ncbi:MAG: cytochrome c oxidase subunit [Pseudomonadota bacterium]
MMRLWPALLLAGCSGVQTMIGGDGRHSALFNDLFVLFLIVCGLFYAAVIAFLLAALVRRRAAGPQAGLRTGLIGWTAAVTIGLSVLIVASFLTDRASLVSATSALRVTVTANQWWWDVRYDDPVPASMVRTANELHLPAGRPVVITLRSNDVIHSFWVPNLAGKQDMIPGRHTDIALVPTRSGRFRGQCAEFCGQQHARMALDIIVEPPARFEAWRRARLQPARAPSTPLQQAGLAYVTGRECSVCHAIAGTTANGQVAPDLTHVASRLSLGAGTFPMTRGHLYGWVADPQSAKPGNHMPTIGLESAELHAVIAYLETLT